MSNEDMMFIIWFRQVWLTQLSHITLGHISMAQRLIGSPMTKEEIFDHGTKLMNNLTDENLMDILMGNSEVDICQKN